MKTLFSQTFFAFLAGLCLLLLLVTGVLFLGIRRSIEDWNLYRGQSLQNMIVPQLRQAYRRDGELTHVNIEEAISHFITDNQYIYVLDPERRPIFMFSQGSNLLMKEQEVIDRTLQRLQETRQMQRAVFDNEHLIAYLSADTLGFRSDMANLRFLHSIRVALGVGVLFSLLLALAVAYVFSRYVSNQAKQLGKGLEQLTQFEGKDPQKTPDFPEPRTKELKTIALSAESLKTRLEHEKKLRMQWAEDIAHDLRTPISALKTQFEGMMEGYIKSTPDKLEALFKELLRLEALVNDLRELNRIESPEMSIHPHNVEAGIFLEDIKSTFGPMSEKADFQAGCSVDRFYGDEKLLFRAVSNVLQNAFHHVTPNGIIEFLIAPNNSAEGCETLGSEFVKFVVRNTGRLDPQEASLIFNRLYRGGNSRSKSGSGLGLSISKAITHLHGGTITASQNGGVTQIVITIPQNG